jgi:HEAT repeat protein
MRNVLIGSAVVIAVAAVAIQFNSLRQLRSELADIRSQLAGSAPAVAANPAEACATDRPRAVVVRRDAQANQRLAELEAAVAELTRESEYLKSRGQLPLAERDLADARARFLNATLSDRDRLRALQQLRRNGRLPDDLALSAMAWVQSSTNAATRRSLLQQLDGVNNPAFKQPLLNLASSEQDSNVREEAVDNLRAFIGDPQVEAALWDILKNDPDSYVRREAEQALSRGPFSESRVAALQERALDSQLSLDDRLMALRALERADADSTSVTAMLAELAQATTNPADKLKLFRAFDGSDDPVVKLPLVHGLQDPNPLVREEAVDALSDFRDDPAVLQWLQYVSQNDADPQVRREAFEALSAD